MNLRNLVFSYCILILSLFSFIQDCSCLTCSTYCVYSSISPMCTSVSSSNCLSCDQNYFYYLTGTCALLPDNIFNSTFSVSAASGWSYGTYSSPSQVFDSQVYTKLMYNTTDTRTVALPTGTYGVRVRLTLFDNTGSNACRMYIVVGASHIQCLQSQRVIDSTYAHQQWIHTTQFVPQSFNTSLKLTIKRSQASPAYYPTGSSSHLGYRDLVILVAQCAIGCSNCTSLNDCQLCTVPQLLDNDTKKCVAACNPGTFQHQTFTYLCVTCDPKCYYCNILSTNCTICTEIGPYQAFYFNLACYTACISGYLEDYDTHTCICPTGYYELLLVCTICHSFCSDCFGATDVQCNKCQLGYYLVNGTNTCAADCGIGQYQLFLQELGLCYLCDLNCYQCDGNATKCISCAFISPTFITYLQNITTDTCVPLCPDGYQGNNITFLCQKCRLGTYSFENVCYSECPRHYTLDQNRACILSGGYPIDLNVSVQSVQSLKLSIKFQLSLRTDSFNQLKTSWDTFVTVYLISLSDPASISGRVLLDQNQNRRSLQFSIDTASAPIITISNATVATDELILFTSGITQSNFLSSYRFEVVFESNLYSPKNVIYQIRTSESTDKIPWIINQYYHYTIAPFVYGGIALAVLIFLSYCVGLISGMKGLLAVLTMEFMHMMQIIGLMLFSIYPRSLSLYLYSYLYGVNFSNFDFIYNVPKYFISACYLDCSSLASFAFIQGDMDWLRLMGSILELLAFIIIVCVISFIPACSRIYSKALFRSIIELTILKSVHSWFGSLMFVILNYSELTTKNLHYSTHLFGYLLLAPMLGYYIKVIYDMGNKSDPMYGHQRYFGLSFATKLIIVLLEVILSLAPVLISTFMVIIAAFYWIGMVGCSLGPQINFNFQTDDFRDNSEMVDNEINIGDKFDRKQSTDILQASAKLQNSAREIRVSSVQHSVPPQIVFHQHLLFSILPITAILINIIILVQDPVITIIILSIVLFIILILIAIDGFLLYFLYKQVGNQYQNSPKRIRRNTIAETNADCSEIFDNKFKMNMTEEDFRVSDILGQKSMNDNFPHNEEYDEVIADKFKGIYKRKKKKVRDISIQDLNN